MASPNIPKFDENFHALTPWINQDEKPAFIINDITLRDGKQALPWWNLWTMQDAARFVHTLADAGVHHVEAGFPAIPGDPETKGFEYIIHEAGQRDIVFFGLARLVRQDIATTIDALKGAKYKGVHTFIGTSPEHLKSRGMTHEQVLSMTRDGVKQIMDAGYLCEFSPEDATRSERVFMMDVLSSAVEEGAHILNIPDTLGYVDAEDYTKLLQMVSMTFQDQIISTHTHNDWGQAEESAKLALKNRAAHRFEGTVFGIGERAGNADWVSVVLGMLAQTKHPRYAVMAKNLLKDPTKIAAITKQFEAMSGLHMRPVAPGHGYEALVNRSGVHQAEVRKMKESYLWQTPENSGFDPRPKFDITPLSGKHGVQEVLFSLGIECNDDMGVKMTEFYRLLFSPDITPDQLKSVAPSVSETDLHNLLERIAAIRSEARLYKNSEANTKKWLAETDKILTDAFFIVDPDYKFGPYSLDKNPVYGTNGLTQDGKQLFFANVSINGEAFEAQALGEVEALVSALKKAAQKGNFTYHPGAVLPMSDNEDALGEMRARMADEGSGESVELFVRDRSTGMTHVKAFMRGINQLHTLKAYQEKLTKLKA